VTAYTLVSSAFRLQRTTSLGYLSRLVAGDADVLPPLRMLAAQ
jgi:hypothetical protein